VAHGSTVTLNGTGSDVQNLSLTYHWALTSKPLGSLAALSSPVSTSPTFVADMPGSYVAQLMVNNGFANSGPSTVTITTTNTAPVANAGPNQTVSVGSTVTLNGSGSSDADRDPLTYSWTFTSKPAGSTAVLSPATAISPTFLVDLPGVYVVQLIVNDGFANSNPATVTITITNTAPVANAGLNQSVTVGSTVTLNGSASSDADHDPLTYAWTFTSKPAGGSRGAFEPDRSVADIRGRPAWHLRGAVDRERWIRQ